jgi:hypothetical protein
MLYSRYRPNPIDCRDGGRLDGYPPTRNFNAWRRRHYARILKARPPNDVRFQAINVESRRDVPYPILFMAVSNLKYKISNISDEDE